MTTTQEKLEKSSHTLESLRIIRIALLSTALLALGGATLGFVEQGTMVNTFTLGFLVIILTHVCVELGYSWTQNTIGKAHRSFQRDL